MKTFSLDDTIAAIATARATGSVGIIRLSGPQSADILQRLCGLEAPPTARAARFVRARDADDQIIDEGLALLFRGPASYTGEDVVELQLHGSPYVLERVLQRCLELGAIAAGPGEFSRRAFENGKLDLAQAEAVADLIAAESMEAARAAQQSLQGVFSQACEQLVDRLLEQRSLIEAWLDFADEDIGEMPLAEWVANVDDTLVELQTLTKEAEQGVRLNQGMTVLIVGAPNAGKSTLLNALARREVAIVSDIAGTTRDLVGEHLSLNGVPLRVIDTAGLRSESADPIEREGIARAHAAAETADRILCLEADDAPAPPIPASWESRVLRVHNKCDRESAPGGWKEGVLHISAKQALGLNELAAELTGRQPRHSGFSARQRHIDALNQAMFHVDHSRVHLQDLSTLELAAEELRLAQESLGRITGQVSNEDLLGRIFAGFCIGK